MAQDFDGDQMSAVHDKLAHIPAQFLEAGIAPEHVASGFMMMALRLTADVYGKRQAAKLFTHLASNIVKLEELDEDDSTSSTSFTEH